MHARRPTRSPCTPSDLVGRHACPATYQPTTSMPMHAHLAKGARPSMPCCMLACSRPCRDSMAPSVPCMNRSLVASSAPCMNRAPSAWHDLPMHESLVAPSAWRPPWSPGVHGDLGGRWECMATYGWVVHVPCRASHVVGRPEGMATYGHTVDFALFQQIMLG
ncbi:hypothetical protein F3Y22_tig00111947pilonHSYRG00052 [Hibiscus syriacus]|uniref:Uncharacterized protein n=1 Tax=Hibiscus syriacus TaxID=106335 RepID=A0A6A2X8C8_HIBSY|nr:hypothetical protein F3Y22_tig00111947pilonHSYRG00052 [Hibiscus syriacus]